MRSFKVVFFMQKIKDPEWFSFNKYYTVRGLL